MDVIKHTVNKLPLVTEILAVKVSTVPTCLTGFQVDKAGAVNCSTWV